ncbi:MAG: hypothetical protein OXC09_09680 [Truepera sp.]|nr:hypothetical protein [Truepera sp.]
MAPYLHVAPGLVDEALFGRCVHEYLGRHAPSSVRFMKDQDLLVQRSQQSGEGPARTVLLGETIDGMFGPTLTRERTCSAESSIDKHRRIANPKGDLFEVISTSLKVCPQNELSSGSED